MALTPEVKTITFNGLTWSYWMAGTGPSLIWLHGLWGEPEWEEHHERLAEQYKVYAPVLPGYYGSDFPPWMSTMEDVALLLIDFMDALSLDAVSICGHSLGAWAAAETAIFRPGRVKAMVLVDPLGVCLDWTRIPNVFYCDPAALAGTFFSLPSCAAAAHYLPPPSQWDERYIVNRAASARLTFEPYLHSRHLPVRLRFANTPALIIWGADDRLLGADHAAQWKALMPAADIAIVKNAGHFPHVEQVNTCLPIMLQFLEATNNRERSR